MSRRGPGSKAAVWATAGSVVSAVFASACCWLPIVLIVFGASAVGLSTAFERVRPFFLLAAGVLLAAGFYLNYFRKEKCGPGSACETAAPRFKRFNRAMLWLATVFVVVFALFPLYAAPLLDAFESSDAADQAGATETRILSVDGMTCGGCEAHVENALTGVPGVLSTQASHDKREAVVVVDTGSPPTLPALIAAVQSVGYEATDGSADRPASAVSAPNGSGLSGKWRTELSDDERGNVECIVHIVNLDENHWVGELDVPSLDVHDYPVDVEVSARDVSLMFTAIRMDARVELSDDGQTMSGTLQTNDGTEPIELIRIGEAEISEMFLELEAVAADPSVVKKLSSDAGELRARFNEDDDKVRLVLLLSPS